MIMILTETSGLGSLTMDNGLYCYETLGVYLR